jgi:hypothetical protein
MDNEAILSADINEDKNDDWFDMKLSSELRAIESAVGLRRKSVVGELKTSLECIQRYNGYVGQ